jgi:hypothetical protein
MSETQFNQIFPSDRQFGFEADWADRHGVPAESMAQYRHDSREGYRVPDMATNFRTWCAACEWMEAQSKPVVVHLPPLNPQAGRLLTSLATAMQLQYVKAIEAAGAQVAP